LVRSGTCLGGFAVLFLSTSSSLLFLFSRLGCHQPSSVFFPFLIIICLLPPPRGWYLQNPPSVFSFFIYVYGGGSFGFLSPPLVAQQGRSLSSQTPLDDKRSIPPFSGLKWSPNVKFGLSYLFLCSIFFERTFSVRFEINCCPFCLWFPVSSFDFGPTFLRKPG